MGIFIFRWATSTVTTFGRNQRDRNSVECTLDDATLRVFIDPHLWCLSRKRPPSGRTMVSAARRSRWQAPINRSIVNSFTYIVIRAKLWHL